MPSSQSARRKLILSVVAVQTLYSAPAALAVVHRPASLPANCVPQAQSVACTFSFTGAEQAFSIPVGVSSLKVTATGAVGGSPRDRYRTGRPVPGGRGAVVSGTVAVTPGGALYVEVGGPGGAEGQSGFNGGGSAHAISGGGGGLGVFGSGGSGSGGGGGGSSLVPPGGTVALATGAASVVITYTPPP